MWVAFKNRLAVPVITAIFLNHLNNKVMSYKWKPNASQRAAYAEKCREKESLPVYTTTLAIREGCYVEFYSLNKGQIISGTVVNSSYGADRGQHTFTIDTGIEKIMVKGRNLYPNIIKHTQGEVSKMESR